MGVLPQAFDHLVEFQPPLHFGVDPAAEDQVLHAESGANRADDASPPQPVAQVKSVNRFVVEYDFDRVDAAVLGGAEHADRQQHRLALALAGLDAVGQRPGVHAHAALRHCAQLRATEAEDALDAGLEIYASPPGKKLQILSLLSGGEKALTATALVFAMFKLNPAPFCLLDEVDAPLDDSNTVRFCDLVKRMSAQTQFLFISHNKISMEMAEQLVGVTMPESGVSRVVAVDIDEALRIREELAA